MKYSKYLILALLSAFWACNDEDPKKEILPSIDTAVHAIAVDKYNTKWIGTDNGLYKSVEDGYVLQEIPGEAEINALYYEESGDMLWIGTGTGLIQATVSADNITASSLGSENLSHPDVLTIHVDQDARRWFGTEMGISLNEAENWKKENFRVNTQGMLFAMDPENFPVNSIASADGETFFATSGARLYRAFGFDPSVNAFSGATQWCIPYNGQSVTDTMFVVFIDSEGRKWMGGKEGIQVHSGQDPKAQDSFTYYYDELPDLYVMAINQAAGGDIWVGTRQGLAVYDGTHWETITAGLPGLWVSSIAFDADGSAWVGTKKGLVHIP
ncbi:MAG: two-component regulator propeller domain-containing protein [Bacteroidota bacterium]